MTDVIKQGDTVLVRDYDDDTWTGYGGTHVLLCLAPDIFGDHPYIVLNTATNEIDKWGEAVIYSQELEERMALVRSISDYAKTVEQQVRKGHLYEEIDIQTLEDIESAMAYLLAPY